MFSLAIFCLIASSLPWFMYLTSQVPMQYCSLQHRNLLPSPVTSTTGRCFHFGSVSSVFLELFYTLFQFLELLSNGESEKITFLWLFFFWPFYPQLRQAGCIPSSIFPPSLPPAFVWCWETFTQLFLVIRVVFYTFVNLHLVKHSLRLCLCVLNNSHKLPPSFSLQLHQASLLLKWSKLSSLKIQLETAHCVAQTSLAPVKA